MTRSASVRAPHGERRRKRRGIRLFLVFAVLVGLLVAADFGFAAVAEHQVSKQAGEQFELDDDPAVHIHGFPFTTQALRGDYSHIAVRAEGVNVADTLRDVDLEADLRDVRAPMSDVLDGNTSAIEIGDLQAVAKLKQGDVGRLIKMPNLSIAPAAERFVRSGNPDDEVSISDLDEQREDTEEYGTTAGVRLQATTNIAGRDTDLTAYAVIELDDSGVQIQPHRLEYGHDDELRVVPDEVRESLLPQFGATIEPGSLPFDVQPSGVAVERGALIVQGTAQDVRFDEGAS